MKMKTSSQIKKEMGQRLKEAREKAGFLTAENFCTNNSIAIEHYLSHENGKIGIKASEALNYCRILKIPMHWLILGN